jgi:hypothetical protein
VGRKTNKTIISHILHVCRTGIVVIAHDTPGDVKASVAVVVTLLIVELLLLLEAPSTSKKILVVHHE